MITLNKEILAKRLSSSNENKLAVSQNNILKSARESYRSLITAEEAIRPVVDQKNTDTAPAEKTELKIEADNSTSKPSRPLGRMIPPKAP